MAIGDPTGGIVAGVGGIAGAVLGYEGSMNTNATNVQLQNSANLTSQTNAMMSGLFNQESANVQMAFQERMSDTAYQRAVSDMKAAGINPLLAVTNGGASSPQGASASMPMAQANAARIDNPIMAGVSTGKDVMGAINQLRATGSAIALQTAQAGNARAQTMASLASAKQADLESGKISALMPSIKAQAELTKAQAESDKSWLPWDQWLNRGNAATGILNKVKDIVNPNSWTPSASPSKKPQNYNHYDYSTTNVGPTKNTPLP